MNSTLAPEPVRYQAGTDRNQHVRPDCGLPLADERTTLATVGGKRVHWRA